MDIAESFVSLTRGNLPCLTCGTAPTALFLHGGIATPTAYMPLLKNISGSMPLLAPTHPGHGAAFPLTTRWSLDDFVATYEELFEKQSWRPDVLIGHSFGGTIALMLAARGIGKKVIVFDAPGLPFDCSPAAYVKILLKEGRDMLRKKPEGMDLKKTVRAAETLLETTVRHPEDVAWFAKHAPGFNIEAEIKTIRQPVFLYWGDHDLIIPLDVGKRLHAAMRTSTLKTLEGRGHAYPITEPVFTYEQIKPVLRI